MIELDFQPEITTQVASRYVAEGDAFVDGLTVSVTKGTWIHLDGAPDRGDRDRHPVWAVR